MIHQNGQRAGRRRKKPKATTKGGSTFFQIKKYVFIRKILATYVYKERRGRLERPNTGGDGAHGLTGRIKKSKKNSLKVKAWKRGEFY